MFKHTSLGLIATAGALVAISLAAPAAAAGPVADACETAVVTKHQARGIAHKFMRAQGYETTLGSLFHYRLGDTVCLDGQWRVGVSLRSTRVYDKTKYVVLVNCHSGEIEEA